MHREAYDDAHGIVASGGGGGTAGGDQVQSRTNPQHRSRDRDRDRGPGERDRSGSARRRRQAAGDGRRYPSGASDGSGASLPPSQAGRGAPRMPRTPVAASAPRSCSRSYFSCDRRGENEFADADDGLAKPSSFLLDCGLSSGARKKAPPPRAQSGGGEYGYDDEGGEEDMDELTDERGYVIERKERPRSGGDKARAAGVGEAGKDRAAAMAQSERARSITKRLMSAVKMQLKRLADPDMQLAGLI